MAENIGKVLRLSEFFSPADGRALLVDTTIAGSNGGYGLLKDARSNIPEISKKCSGVILNPGQMEKIASRLPGKRGAAPIVRLDWSNAFRDKSFIFPARLHRRVMISDPEDALELGATAAVVYLLLGYDEDFESENINSYAMTARACSRINLPLIVDVRLAGPRIERSRYAAAVKLGVDFAVEGGADAIIIPWPGSEAMEMIREFSPVPVLINCPSQLIAAGAESDPLRWLSQGAAGLVLSGDLFRHDELDEVLAILERARAMVHPDSAGGSPSQDGKAVAG